MDMQILTISAVSGVAASIVSAPLGHWLANRRHVTQRWWESKAEAYSAVMAGLSKVRVALNDLLAEFAGDISTVDAAVVERCTKQWDASAEEIERIAHQSAFKLSSEAEGILGHIGSALRESPQEPLDAVAVRQWLLDTTLHVAVATKAMSIEARHDLGVLGPRGEVTRIIGERGSLRRRSLQRFFKGRSTESAPSQDRDTAQRARG